jgi:polar amino acid transport system permease protein
MYSFSLQAITPYLSALPEAMWTTFSLSALTAVISGVLGIFGALARRNKLWLVRFVMGFYVEAMRNIPLLIVLYLVFFTLPSLGLRLDGYYAALIALTLNSTAYMTEIFRSGLVALPRGQHEAAASQGMTSIQSLRLVVLPQILRTIYAPLGNQLIAVVVGSSLASVVSVSDLTAWMGTAGAASFRYFEIFLVVAASYFVLCQSINIARVIVGKILFGRQDRAMRQ